MKRDLRHLFFAISIIAVVFFQSCADPRPPLVPAAANVPGGPLFFAEALENGDFTQGTPGEWPLGWHRWATTSSPLCDAETVSAREKGANYSNCKSGGQCAKLRATRIAFPEPCFFAQGIDATAYRGKRFVFRANVRTEVSDPSIAYILVRVHTAGPLAGAFEPMTTSFFEHVPITSQKWGKYEITGVVDTDAHDIELGLQLRGQGDAWIDDASLKFSSKPEYSPRAALISTPRLFHLKPCYEGRRSP